MTIGLPCRDCRKQNTDFLVTMLLLRRAVAFFYEQVLTLNYSILSKSLKLNRIVGQCSHARQKCSISAYVVRARRISIGTITHNNIV